MDILSELNPAQREAVEAIEGPLLIIAGPGSGKTRVIAHRIAYLIRVVGISPRRIMAVTFTNKASREMRDRVYQLLGQGVEELTLGTFHHIAAQFLRLEGRNIGIDRGFVIYDEDDQLNLIKHSLEDLSLDPKYYPPRALKAAISAAKARLIAPEEYSPAHYFEEVTKRVYLRYQQRLRENTALDFDDLLMQAVLLFRDYPDVLSKYQSRYLHLLIDEFQDTNMAQYLLSKQIAGEHRNICVVGDPDQSIYSWRFADLRHILDFEKDYPEAKVVFLEQNYRSTKTILEAANYVISANCRRKEKNLWTENEPGTSLTITQTYNEQEESQFVVSEVERLTSNGGFRANDCSVMYRTNAQSRPLEETFIRYGMPYKLVGGTRFYERREIKDIIAYLRVLHNPYDRLSLSRIINIPPRGIGAKTVAQLSIWAREQGIPLYSALKLGTEDDSPLNARQTQALARFYNLLDELGAKSEELNTADLLNLVVERTGYKDYILEGAGGEERWENILELRTVAAEYQDLEPKESLARFLEGVTLVSDVDRFDEESDAVTLITLHQAKGLEFPVVFIVGLEEGLLPHFKSLSDPEQLEEERRLCYVGITRAKKRVYLSHALRRSLMGSSSRCIPSRFLRDIPPHLIAPSTPRWHIKGEAMPVPSPHLAAFKTGERVLHSTFGEGMVIDCLPAGNDYELTVIFKDGKVKKLLQSMAPLERIS